MFIFPKNLLYFVFLKYPFWDSPFSLITDEVFVLLLFIGLNNPSQRQYILAFVSFLEAVFYWIKKSGRKVWSVKFSNFKQLRLKLAHNNFLCKHSLLWVVHKKGYSFKWRLISYNALFFCNVAMLKILSINEMH